MPRADRLSTRLDTLLEAVFESPSDPFSIYWDIAAHIASDEIAQAQRTLRERLKQKGPLRVETAILAACLMNLGGFPPLRILHFLSLYVPGGIRPSLFELAVGAIFLGVPPLASSVLYDLTRYTYLEKRLLVRKSIEISEKLADSLDPRVLLFLYLLALRDDLSNEHVRLIALVLKRSIPSRELRGRIGSASLEEFGEIARAVKTVEERSLELDLGAGPGAVRSSRSFNRKSASFFLDKYFSDEAIAEARASAPEIPKRPVRPRPVAKASAPDASFPAVPAARSARRAPARSAARSKRIGGSGLVALPTVLAAIVLAILLGVVPAGLRSPPAEPPAVTYVVKPGDSLWKIFTSMQAAPGDRSGWLDFLSHTQSANGLGGPDQLKPGKVLTLSPPH